MSKDKVMAGLVVLGMLMIVAAILIPLLTMSVQNPAFRYIYAAGALFVLIGRVFSPYRGANLRVKRLVRLEAWAAIFFCVGAFFLFYPPHNPVRDTLAFTLAGGVVQIYTSIMIPRARRRKSEFEF